jgi:pimeloyl-ACP methyl ester carboxylesterase
MTAVFVNGNPESAAIWTPLLERLDREDVLCVSPPGFGAPLPEGFECTPEGYARWLIGRVEEIGAPVDLVGHDIGGSATVVLAMRRPDLLRSWISDSLGVFHPEYRWHDLAEGWQTPLVGERSVEAMLDGGLEQRIARMVDYGMPAAVGAAVAQWQGEEMQRAILAFYRAAAQPAMADLGKDLQSASRTPGLAVIGTEDRLVGSENMRRQAAEIAGAAVAVLPGAGHLWMLQAPDLAAELINGFWRGTR